MQPIFRSIEFLITSEIPINIINEATKNYSVTLSRSCNLSRAFGNCKPRLSPRRNTQSLPKGLATGATVSPEGRARGIGRDTLAHTTATGRVVRRLVGRARRAGWGAKASRPACRSALCCSQKLTLLGSWGAICTRLPPTCSLNRAGFARGVLHEAGRRNGTRELN